MKSSSTFVEDEVVVPEMLLHIAGLDWQRMHAFNCRICNGPAGENTDIVQAPCFGESRMRLPNKNSPMMISLLRSIAAADDHGTVVTTHAGVTGEVRLRSSPSDHTPNAPARSATRHKVAEHA